MISKVFRRAGLSFLFMIATAVCELPEEQPAPPAVDCGPEEIRNILEIATPADPAVVVNCSLSVPSNFVITKRLIVQGVAGSGITINCNGQTIDGTASGDPGLSEENAGKDMLLIKSAGGGDPWTGTWRRPTDVTVKNCKIIGAVRILGIDNNEDLEVQQTSSYEPGHPARMRHIAPTRITFENVDITGRARIPLYVGIGVTHFKLVNSELDGFSDAVAIYLDAESSQSLIKNNYVHTVTSREVLAIDASDYNRIIDNRFSALSRGGIYLYRNCGERGVVRHTTPSHNTIVNNLFYYDKYSPNPYYVHQSVYLGSRNGGQDFCDDDEHDPTIGSGASDLDYARHNVVMQNQIYKLPVSLMIQEGESTDSPNYIDYNTTVVTPISRLAGCYVRNGYYKDFIVHGESIDVYRINGQAYTGRLRTCDDGELTT